MSSFTPLWSTPLSNQRPIAGHLAGNPIYEQGELPADSFDMKVDLLPACLFSTSLALPQGGGEV